MLIAHFPVVPQQNPYQLSYLPGPCGFDVCICVCLYVCVFVCLCMCTYICVYGCICMCVWVSVCAYVCVYGYLCVCVSGSLCMSVCVYVCLCICLSMCLGIDSKLSPVLSPVCHQPHSQSNADSSSRFCQEDTELSL